jgi:hypothetical protein
VPVVEVEAASAYAKAEKAPGTRRAYRSDFAIFQAWCADRSASALPAQPATVAAFLGWEARRRTRPSTIGRRVAAIRYAHQLAGHEIPTDDERVRATMRGIRRTVGTAPTKKTPAPADRIAAMAPVASSLHGEIIRQRAVDRFEFGPERFADVLDRLDAIGQAVRAAHLRSSARDRKRAFASSGRQVKSAAVLIHGSKVGLQDGDGRRRVGEASSTRCDPRAWNCL